MKKSVLFFALIVGLLTSASTAMAQTTYALWIAGVQVTSANCSDLSVIPDVSGTVKYDPANKVLTLQGATIQINTTNAIKSNIDGLTIKVIGTNNLTTGDYATLYFKEPLTITGGGVLNANSIRGTICADGTILTIDGCTVNAKGRYGIVGEYGTSIKPLIIKNSTVTAEGTEGSIANFASLTLDGCAITQPAGAAFDASLKAVALGGSVVTSKVVISPTQPNMDSYITLTVAKDSAIKLDFMAAAAGTPVRIVSGSNTQNITVGTDWYNGGDPSTFTVTAGASTMTIYGDITGFKCGENYGNLTSLDLSQNTQLMALFCYRNTINSLNVSRCTQLTKLSCFSNTLTNLDVSRNTQLMALFCYDNNLSSLDVSGCTQLTTLWCYDNKLSSLDVSGCTQLTSLWCFDNKLTTAALDDIYCALPDRTGEWSGVIRPVYSDTSSNHAIVLATNKANAIAKNWKVRYGKGDKDIATTGTYVCQANTSRYITLTVKNGKAIKFDLKAASAGTLVRIVSGSNTQDITVGTDWYDGGYPSSFTVTADGTTMTVYGDIIGFSCYNNGENITGLDPSHNTKLTELYCSSNRLTSLDVSGCTRLMRLGCTDNRLTGLDLSHNTQLTVLNCTNNRLSSLDLSHNTKLTELYCYKNKFSTQALDAIYCALPDRDASDDAKVFPLHETSSTAEADAVVTTTVENATDKNWKVQTYKANHQHEDIATTGTYDCSTAISAATAEPSLTLYPNPVADVLYLSATARTIRIYNIYGIEVAHATDTDRIDVAHLPAGVYTVRADGTVAKMVKR